MTTEWTSDKIYDQCAYLNCNNGKYSTGHKLFRFPVCTDLRHDLWIRYAGNARLRTWPIATLGRAGICGDHFSPESFVDENRQTLRRNAVPRSHSSTNAHAKPSPTLLAQIESLPRKETRTREKIDSDSEDPEGEFETRKLSRDADAETSRHAVQKSMETHVVGAVKTLRKVKQIKIEEQVSNSSRTVILERCKNPETCPASRQTLRDGGKPRPHFHKVYAKNTEEIKILSRTPKSYGAMKSRGPIAEQMKVENAEEISDSAKLDVRDEKTTSAHEKLSFQLERYHINLSKDRMKKEELSTTSRFTAEPKDLMSSWRAIQKARVVPALTTVSENNRKKLSTDIIEEYYRTKDEKPCDRCAYINCKNTKLTTGAHLFRFPQITDPRLRTWIKNAGNPKMLHWAWSTIRRAGLCADHFTKDSFFNETRQRLLRTAVPKPFYLEEDVSAEEQDEKLSPGDVLKVFNIMEKDNEVVPIDLPSAEMENRETLKIRYPFEDPGPAESDDEEVANFNVDESEETVYGSFASVMVMNESPDHQEDDKTMETLATSGRTFVKEELIEESDPLDNANASNEPEDDPEEVDNIREILALQQQKARLCRVIKQFSSKLTNAKIRKSHLRSQLCTYRDLQMY